jgi:protoporphyrinogen oxidase
MKNIILGAGIAGIAASHELNKHNINSIILEKNNNWGGLLDNFSISGFRFDKFIHLSFASDSYVNDVFLQTPHIKHIPLPSNYFKGRWLKHPAQNNLYPLNKEEQKKIIDDFKNRKDLEASQVNNYEDWLRIQYGDYFAENFPMVYTQKYWTIPARELETKWVGERMYKPTLEEVEKGCQSDLTPNTYYAKEMRYPEKGGYKSFLKPMAEGLDIRTNSEVHEIDISKNQLTLSNGESLKYDNLISSLPLPEICKLIKDVPEDVVKASKKLNYTSGYLVSLGFNTPDIANKLWFYIYDKEILPARVYSPSLKSPDNAPLGCSSLQAEIYFSKANKLKLSDAEILQDTIDKFIAMGLFKLEDLVVKDIRTEKYANVIFDHHIYVNRKIVLDFLSAQNIISVGRFGAWDYFWSDQSLLSGRDGAQKLIKKND